jgi:hypothetical protein
VGTPVIWISGVRSVSKVVEETTSPVVKIGKIHWLSANGTVTVTVTAGVFSVTGEGSITSSAPVTPKRPSTSCARASASATLAPGTIIFRAASYEALSTTWRTRLIRVNSMETMKNKMTKGMIIANSTAAAATRRELLFVDSRLLLIDMSSAIAFNY